MGLILFDGNIQKFEPNKDISIIQFEKTPNEHINREGRPTFHQINFHNLKEWQPFSKTLQIVFKKYIHIYEKECNITEYHWPIQYGYEQYRIKKYLPNDKDEFKNLPIENYDKILWKYKTITNYYQKMLNW